MSDEDWDEEEELLVSGRGAKAAGRKRARGASGSEDDEYERRGRATAAKSGSRRGAAAAAAADPGGDEDEDEDEDGLNAEERAKLETMNELEREMYLFEREETLQRQRERKQALNAAKRDADKGQEVRASSRRARAPSGTDSAIGRIAAAHAEREARERRKQQQAEQQGQQQTRRERSAADSAAERSDRDYRGGRDDGGDDDDDDGDDRADLEPPDAAIGAAPASGLGARAETYDDEGASYEEDEERAALEDVRSVTLRRANLEAWHSEPFFEDDVRGCMLRIADAREQARTGQPSYLLVKVHAVVQRNSYSFPPGAKNSRTRKWLHLDDMCGTIFRQQMTIVSNGEVTVAEYERALARSQRAGCRFVTKGDVAAAAQRLQHARTFKYDPELVRQLLERKRAAGKIAGSVAERKARLQHELNVARQEGALDEEVARLEAELSRLEQQDVEREAQEQEQLRAALGEGEAGGGGGGSSGGAIAAATAGGAPMSADVVLALINARNRDRNNQKILQAGAVAALPERATAGSGAGGDNKEVFRRRHTTSRNYWVTSRRKEPDGDGVGGDEGTAAAGPPTGGAVPLQRQRSSVTEVDPLDKARAKLPPSELVKALSLNVDLSRLPRGQPTAMLPRRVLGQRWLMSVQARQQGMEGRSMLTLDEWKRKTAF